jgi:hypothetical protein
LLLSSWLLTLLLFNSYVSHSQPCRSTRRLAFSSRAQRLSVTGTHVFPSSLFLLHRSFQIQFFFLRVSQSSQASTVHNDYFNDNHQMTVSGKKCGTYVCAHSTDSATTRQNSNFLYNQGNADYSKGFAAQTQPYYKR